MLSIFHLGQFSIKVAPPTNIISYRFKLPQEGLEFVAFLDIGADWVGAADRVSSGKDLLGEFLVYLF
jgi:hypothetical protein